VTDGLTYLFWTLQYLFLIPKTYWLNGVWVSPLTCLKILLNLSLTPWPAHFWPCPSHHCGHDCLGYNALEVYLGHFSQPNPLLLRHWVGAWVALVATIIADAHFGSGLVLANFHISKGMEVSRVWVVARACICRTCIQLRMDCISSVNPLWRQSRSWKMVSQLSRLDGNKD